MRVEDGFFRVFPYENPNLVPFEAAVRKLNPVVAVKIRNPAVQAAIRKMQVAHRLLHSLADIVLVGPTPTVCTSTPTLVSRSSTASTSCPRQKRTSVVPSLYAYIAHIFPFLTPPQRDERSVVLWSYSLETMIPICQEFEEKLIKHIWQTRAISHRPTPSSNPSVIASPPFSPNDSQADLNEKKPVNALEVKEITPPPPAHVKRHWWSWRLQPADKGARPASDPEKGVEKRKKRKLVLIGPIYAGLGAGLSACMRISIPN